MIDIDPTVDFACKMLLGNPEHPQLTIHFLNSVLRPDVPIVAVEYLNPIQPQQFEDDKLAILDILAEDGMGRRYNIEVQRTVPAWLPERLTYYVATQLIEQIGKGDSYHQLRPSIGICLLKGVLFPGRTAYHHQFRLRTELGFELTECLEINTLELPKYGSPNDNEGVVLDPLEQWMDFFCRAQGRSHEAIQRRLPSPIFAEALGVLEMISRHPEQRRYYQARLKWELDENTRLAAEAAAREESERRGRLEGQLEGRLEGRLEGQAQERIRMIQSFQTLLGQPGMDEAELNRLDFAQLGVLLEDLQMQIRKRID
ncbi:MAG: Rpn family recombination-promoting nuclease/putative transposase [Planctomycetaceae bacterium]|nr:Rpn family recombination-promoting nuclease/putative transposase [Planctomycetaceae bacterium]